MRLTTAEHQAIRQAITEVDPEATIYLFGSRANDNARGGDIDLLVISRKIRLMDKLTVLARLHMLVTYEDAKKAANSIRKAVDPCSIVLFGSVARGRVRK